MGQHSNGRLLALTESMRLEWNWMVVAKTLAYYDTSKITAIKSFIVQASSNVSMPFSIMTFSITTLSIKTLYTRHYVLC